MGGVDSGEGDGEPDLRVYVAQFCGADEGVHDAHMVFAAMAFEKKWLARQISLAA